MGPYEAEDFQRDRVIARAIAEGVVAAFDNSVTRPQVWLCGRVGYELLCLHLSDQYSFLYYAVAVHDQKIQICTQVEQQCNLQPKLIPECQCSPRCTQQLMQYGDISIQEATANEPSTRVDSEATMHVHSRRLQQAQPPMPPPAPGPPPQSVSTGCPSGVFINEIHYADSGSVNNDFVELARVAGTVTTSESLHTI